MESGCQQGGGLNKLGRQGWVGGLRKLGKLGGSGVVFLSGTRSRSRFGTPMGWGRGGDLKSYLHWGGDGVGAMEKI